MFDATFSHHNQPIGLKGKIHAQDEAESPLKAWENVKLNILQIKTHTYTINMRILC